MSRDGNTDQSDAFEIEQTLPEPLPAEPWGVFREWYDHAQRERVQPNPHAMTLATIDPDGRPSARIVLCKGMDLSPGKGYIVFYTNYEGRKGRALLANPRAALVMHWDTLDRQIRLEGQCTVSPPEESDAYFKTRPVESRIGAWASHQSRPIASRDALLEQVAEVVQRFGVTLDDPESAVIPRPPHWGGFRFWADAVELWVGGPGRVHDRARWTRTLAPASGGGGGFVPGAWAGTRLQP